MTTATPQPSSPASAESAPTTLQRITQGAGTGNKTAVKPTTNAAAGTKGIGWGPRPG